MSWGAGFYDFNNDGFKDLFVANGHIYPQVDQYGLKISYRQLNKLYLNTGRPRLLNVSQQAGPGFQVPKSSRGAAFSDFNNDGSVDIAVAVLDETPLLLMNQPLAGQNWLWVKLEGAKSNKSGVGARVTVKCGPQTQTREVKAGGSFASSSDVRAHFGLGTCGQVDEIAVRWPSGNVSTVKGVAAGQVLTIKE